MTESKRQQDCPPAPKDPAGQPRPCSGGDPCAPIPTTTPPNLTPPEPCEVDADCNCPKPHTPRPTCIDNLIAKYTASITAAEGAIAFKKDLDTVLANAKASDVGYTRDKYTALVKAWVDNDTNLAELIRKLICSVPCWKCVLECYVCPVLNDAHIAEEYLWRDTVMPGDVSNIYDLQYWYTRDVAVKNRRFQRIQAVLKAWNGPADKIGKILAANATLIDATNRLLGTDPGKAVYDVFMKLVPLHLAVAPPAGSKWSTRIGKEYTEFCCCDRGMPDDCCGPDVGVLSLRDRLIGPQPYLIEPHDFFKLICCIVEKRYAPAKEALDTATAALAAVTAQIAAYVDVVGKFDSVNGAMPLTAWDNSVRTTIPSAIDCCDYDRGEGESSTSPSAM